MYKTLKNLFATSVKKHLSLTDMVKAIRQKPDSYQLEFNFGGESEAGHREGETRGNLTLKRSDKNPEVLRWQAKDEPTPPITELTSKVTNRSDSTKDNIKTSYTKPEVITGSNSGEIGKKFTALPGNENLELIYSIAQSSKTQKVYTIYDLQKNKTVGRGSINKHGDEQRFIINYLSDENTKPQEITTDEVWENWKNGVKLQYKMPNRDWQDFTLHALPYGWKEFQWRKLS